MKKFINNGRNNMIKKVSKFLFLSASLITALATLSCEVGLGSAIDTEAPSASITYPPESAIIRDYFYLAGTCSDDDKVDRVEVTLVCDGSTVFTRNANIEDNKSWSLRVNERTSGGYNGYPLPDGSYTANVTVFDGSGRSTGPYARSFTIDNTAPIFIISSPNSITSDKDYGTTLNVNGTLADSSGLSEMKLSVYEVISANTIESKGTYSVKDIDTSDGTSVDFARFNKSDLTSPLSENYQAIYGTVTLTGGDIDITGSANPKKNYKTSVVLYDKAKVYQSPATLQATSSVGNSTSTVYSYSDVYTKLLGGAPLSLTPGDLIKNMNGKMSSSAEFGGGTQTVKAFMDSKAIDTSSVDNQNNPNKLLMFTLDPKARPNFVVTTLTNENVSTFNANALTPNMSDEAKKNAITSRVATGQILTATVQGFGTTEIQGNQLRMWMHRLESGEFTKSAIQSAITNLENVVYSNSSTATVDANGVLQNCNSEWIEITDPTASYDNSTTITMNSKNLPTLLTQEFYVVAITGRDAESATIDQSKIYGFMGQPTSAMPVIEITSIEDNKYYTGSDYSNMTIAGTATAGGSNNLTKVEVFATYGTTTTNPVVLSSSINAHSYNISKELSEVVSSLNIPSTENNFSVILQVRATDQDNNSSTKRLKINVDRLAPEIRIASAGPVVTEYNGTSGHFINGKFITEINITEVKLSSVSYKITNGTYESDPITLGNASTYTIEIPTTGTRPDGQNYANGSTLKLTYTATDEAGNSYELDSTEYTIKQETDKPKISILNADVSKKNESDDLSGDNLFDTTTKSAVKIAVEDDDYINKVDVKIWYINDSGVSEPHIMTPSNAFVADTTTYYSTSYELENYEGVYKIEVNVDDSTLSDVATDPDRAAYRKNTDYFYIALDKSVPLITEDTGSTTKITNLESPLTYSGTVSDSNGFYNNGNGNGKGAISAVATKVGETTPAKTWTSIDVSNVSNNTSGYTGTWTLPISSSDFTGYGTSAAEGTYTIAITIKDAAGRTKTINRSMKLDTSKPVISSAAISNTAHTASDSSNSWYNSANLDITATATDAGGSLSKVEFVKVPSAWTTAAAPTSEQLNGQSWTKMNALSTANTYGYTASELVSASASEGATAIAVKATDTAGNVTYAKINAVNIDTSAPQLDTVSATGTEGDANVYVKIGDTESKTSTALSSVRSDQSTDAIVKVALKDEGGSGIDSGKIYISVHDRFGNAEPDSSKKVNVTLADDSAAACGLSSGIYKFTIPHGDINNGSVYMRYYDMAGNYTDTIIFSFYVDNTAPTASITSPISTDVNGKLMITGTAEDETALREVKLYYTTTAPTSSTSVATFTASNLIGTIDCTGLTSKEWSFGGTTGVDFEAIANVTSRAVPKTIYIVPVVYDEAGHVNNFWEQCRTYNVDLNSDRPVIKFAELRNEGQIFTYTDTGAISGTISDDDDDGTKVVTKLIISSSAITIGSDGEPTNSASETTFNSASGEWTFTPADNSDGTKNVYIYVEDNAGGKFYTGATYASGTCGGDPYIQLNGSAKSGNMAGLSYKIDNQGPSVNSIVLEWRNAATGDADDSSDEVSRATVVGGTKRYYRLKITGHDTSGVSSMTLALSNQGSASNYEELDSETDGTFAAAVNAGVTSEEDFVWTTPWIDSKKEYTVSGSAHTIEDEILSGMISITDASGIDGASSVTFTIDNRAPTASVISPNPTNIQTGTVTINATANDNGDAGLASVKWMVPLSSQTTMTDAQLASLATATAAEITAGTDSGKWRPFTLDGTTYTTSLTEANAYNKDVNSGKYTDTTTFGTTIYGTAQASAGDNTYDIPIYVLATDNAGNYFVRKTSIRYCPNASIPKSYFTYPTSDDYDRVANGSSQQNYITLGGTIRLNGVSEDDMGIAANFIQIDTDLNDSFNNANYDSTDKNYLADKYEIVEDLSSYGITVPDGWWGIKCSGTSSWNCVLNDSEQLVSTNPETPRNISIRVCSIDIDDGTTHLCNWSDPINIKVDDKAPKIGNRLSKMYQFDAAVASISVSVSGSGSTETVTTTASSSTGDMTPQKITDYYSNMFLRGDWYYAISIEDENAIQEVNVYKNNSTIPLVAGTDYKFVNYTPENTWRKQIVYIPIDKSNTEVSYRIKAKDQDTTIHTTEQTFNFKIDNEAPEFESFTNEGTEVAATGVTFRDSNYTFDISGTVNDSTTGSGIDYLLFYFTRTYGTGSSAVTKIFDAVAQGQTADDGVDISTLEELSITQGSGSTAQTYKLYGKKFTGGTYTSSGSTFSYTATGISTDEHIRKGGLIYIDGMYHVITDKSGNTVEFENAASGATDAIFPYAHVVNKGEKSRSATVNPTTKRYADSVDYDEDGIIETFNGNDFAKTFKAEFYSRDIPDGPATLNCILFDKAGNVTGKTVSGTISNHAPRLAKLYLGTDLNDDNSYDETEFNSYIASTVSALDPSQVTEYQQTFVLETADAEYGYNRSFKVTNDLVVIPEYTGGNGTLRLRYLNNASSATERQTATTAQLINPYTGTSVTANFTPLKNGISGDTQYLEDNTQTIFILDGSATIGTDGTDKAVSFTFWDETDGLTQGQDSEYFFVRITDLNVDLTDEAKPNVYINPFHWNSLTDNSIYGTERLTDIKQIQGHIELESDWAKSSGYVSTDTTGEFDSDPKVSGIIVVRGTAYDDQRLSAIQVSLPGFAFTGARGGTTTAGGKAMAATYSSATKKWTNAGATLATNGWSFKVYDINDSVAATRNTASKKGAFYGQRGHQVYWELCIDTSKVTNKVALDEQLVIQALDHNSNETVNTATKTGTGTVAETANKSNYRMDIVPYITSVTTGMSIYETNNPSVYARSSTGSYPVYAVTASGSTANHLATYDYETVTLNGFNLGAGTVSFTSGNATVNASLQVTIPAAATSGAAEYYATVSGVSIYALNNRNYNNSFGTCDEADIKGAGFSKTKTAALNDTAANTLDYAGGKYKVYKHFYNRQPNDENNNVLTDDLSFDIWDINQKAAVAINNGKADNPVMKINPNSGMIGFAFSNGGTWFSMPNTTNSYQYWNMSYDYMQYNELAYDLNGYSYTTTVGGDISSETNDRFSFMTSRWGAVTDSRTDQGANYGGSNHIRIDPIGNDASNRRKDRFQSPSIAVNGNDVYLAYYDLLNSQLHFKSGRIGNTKRNFGNFADRDSNNSSSDYSQQVSWLNDNGTYGGLGAAGPYVSIGVTSTNQVVMVWYDSVNDCLRYSLNTSARNTNNNENYHVGKNTTGWGNTTTLFTGGGKYCKLVVDNANGVHIAAYDSENNAVRYIYIANVAQPGTRKEALVDLYSGVGENLTIDVANDGNYQVPHISYWSAYPALPKYATLAKPEVFFAASDAVDGCTENGEFTGIWNCSYVATTSSPQKNTVNVGVWKNSVTANSAGNLAYSRTGNNRGLVNGTNSHANSYAGNTTGVCYGNGTNNAVLGYIVAPTSSQYNIETAQKK